MKKKIIDGQVEPIVISCVHRTFVPDLAFFKGQEGHEFPVTCSKCNEKIEELSGAGISIFYERA